MKNLSIKKTLAERLAEMKAEEQSNVSRETEEQGLNDDEFEFLVEKDDLVRSFFLRKGLF